MTKKVLITGISGFIGHHTALKLMETDYRFIGLIRPGTDKKRIEDLKRCVNFYEADLANIIELREFLQKNKFDAIIHIGAVRGGRSFPKDIYLKANVDATKELVKNAYNNDSKFIFCSSVGVFGAIPQAVPADENTPKQDDNYYHFTKNRCEKIIDEYVQRGLKAVIVRPSITYGTGDYGFPYTLIKLVQKRMLFLPDQPVKIHLTNVKLLAQAFKNLLVNGFESGQRYIIADKEPVELREMAQFIASELRMKNYSPKIINKRYFAIAESVCKKIRNEIWTARFQLISKDWYYNVEPAYKNLKLDEFRTIPEFRDVVEWFKKNQIKK
ncbi:MAG: NAD(P)-dependent oxidoreductase [Candidatus Cloacimonetes bacterium]|nr:NAD(P)-dependent oxidoreductase [Candidatus Cloacimonadota bacterium]